MNNELLEQIVKHIFANLLIIPSDFIDLDKSKSLMTKDFLLPEKISVEMGEYTFRHNIWGCQISAGDHEFKILLADCTQIKKVPEFCLLVQLINAPAYGLYLSQDKENSESLIACTMNEKDWLVCNTFLQATFLAGMEQIKDLGLGWAKCTNYKSHIEMLKSFIRYHDSYYEEEV